CFIPIMAMWLGYLEGGLLAISLVLSLISLDVGGALAIVVSVFNYLIFFWPELVYQVNRLRGRANHARQPNVIQFKKASRDLKKQNYTHKCTVCGRTDVDYPDLEFRYCSRCVGYHCYCIDHINNHVHITEE
ncbi:MAG: hypothetical protein LIO45_02480, partial [Clostridiales bacterium]|nr:hypothetical protein [Clostridiales bacterium]